MLRSFLYCFAYKTSLSFFFNDTPTTEIYTLSLHDALPICITRENFPHVTQIVDWFHATEKVWHIGKQTIDRKSTRLNSSHTVISYAVFCLRKTKDQRHRVRDTYRTYKATTCTPITQLFNLNTPIHLYHNIIL